MAVQGYCERVVFPYFKFYCSDAVIAQLLTGQRVIDRLIDFKEGDSLFMENGVTVRHKGAYYELVGNSQNGVQFGKDRLPEDLAETVNYIITSGINKEFKNAHNKA